MLGSDKVRTAFHSAAITPRNDEKVHHSEKMGARTARIGDDTKHSENKISRA